MSVHGLLGKSNLNLTSLVLIDENRTRLLRGFSWGILWSRLLLGMSKKPVSMIVSFSVHSWYILVAVFHITSVFLFSVWCRSLFMFSEQNILFLSFMRRCSTVFPVLFTHMLWEFDLVLIEEIGNHHNVSSDAGLVFA